jgi:hypothetical protein
MRLTSIVPSLALALASLALAACGDDSSSEGGSDGSTSGGDTTTSGTPTTAPGDSTGTPPPTTDPSTSTTTGDPDTTTTDTPADSSSSGEASSSEGTDTGTDDGGVVGPQPWGDCVNLPTEYCLPGESCISDSDGMSAFGVCSQPACATAMDCPPAPVTGDAPVACIDAAGDMELECVLDCSMGQTCPDGMTCYADTVCTHELVAFACADETTMGPLPLSLSGTTTGAGNETAPPCAGADADDYAFQFTAPFTATYDIDTGGSGFDTILYVLSDCGGPPIACNDDTYGLQSRVLPELVAGETVLIVVDGYNEVGNFDLNIDFLSFDGDCCTWDAKVAGCEVPGIESCVCAIDNFCCDVEWDDLCVDIAKDDCGASCPL